MRKYEIPGGRPGNPMGKSKNCRIREFLLKAIVKSTLWAIDSYNILIGLLNYENHFWGQIVYGPMKSSFLPFSLQNSEKSQNNAS
jgi:hypothetical protein